MYDTTRVPAAELGNDLERTEARGLELPKDTDAESLRQAIEATARGEVSGFFEGSREGERRLMDGGAKEDISEFMTRFNTEARQLLHELEDTISEMGGETTERDVQAMRRREEETMKTVLPPEAAMTLYPDGTEQEEPVNEIESSPVVSVIPKGDSKLPTIKVPKFD